MKSFTDYSNDELAQLYHTLLQQYHHIQSNHLDLNLSRGKPSALQLDLSMDMLQHPHTYTLSDGTDGRNYGNLQGITECRDFFGQLLHLHVNEMIIGGASSLNMMFDVIASLCLFGTENQLPWSYYKFNNEPIKFLCPVPGYDRHFTICEELGIEMVPIPLLHDGPDMDQVETLVKADSSIKGIWCVPLHSNPSGTCYSDEVIIRLASMETAASDFRIFWDNAYGIHHIYENVPLKNIIEACKEYHHPNRVFYFFSTSKITFPGAGIALVSSSQDNIKELLKHMSAQTIGHDKLNQLRHIEYFKTPEAMCIHMEKHAEILKPKFNLVLDKLFTQLSNTDCATWTIPKGGYFISLNTRLGCAKRTVTLAKEAGIELTSAGATYPYGKDPLDQNIRLAPTYPTLSELDLAMDILILCIKLATIESILHKGDE